MVHSYSISWGSRIRLILALSFLAVLLTGFVVGTLHAQNADEWASVESSGGTLYYIAFPDTVSTTFDPRPELRPELLDSRLFALIIYSPVDQAVKIGRVNGSKENVLIKAGRIIEYNTESIRVPLITTANTPQSNVLQVEADFPVIVYAYMGTAFGSAAFTPIPVQGWGTEYYTASWPGEVVQDLIPEGTTRYRTEPKEAPGEILIVAAFDNTEVVIEPTAELRKCNGCETVMLDAGQSYLVQSTVDVNADSTTMQPDLGGTRIRSNHPVGVISGNTRVMHSSRPKFLPVGNVFKDLALEWLSPVSQHGTEFAFTPTWDSRRVRDGLDSNEAREAELVRIYGTQRGEQTEVSWYSETGKEEPASNTPLKAMEYTEELVAGSVARGFKTTSPAYAVMSPQSVIRYDGPGTWGANYSGDSYSAWGSYMVELIPRERWTSFAPFKAPSWPPGGTEHFLNVVTDSANQFNVLYRQDGTQSSQFHFNGGRIPGTDLVWGAMPVNPQVGYTVHGLNGARFAGHVYGMRAGFEGYEPAVQNFSRYEGNLSLCYGFPLASARCELVEPDEYRVEATEDCGIITVHIQAIGDNPVGLRSLRLDPDSSVNLRLEFVTPSDRMDLEKNVIDQVTVRLVPINPERETRGVLQFNDRSCNSKLLRFEFQSDGRNRIESNPEWGLDFGKVLINETSEERYVAIVNPLTKPINIYGLRLVRGDQTFQIKRTNPSFNWSRGQDSVTLLPGNVLAVHVDVTPGMESHTYTDTLAVDLGCDSKGEIALSARTGFTCLTVNDLDFGLLIVGDSRTLKMRICNNGGSVITFEEPYLKGLSSEFTVDQVELDRLGAATLRPNDCIEIAVRFSSESAGKVATDVIIASNPKISSSDCSDIAQFRANVIDTTSGVSDRNQFVGYEVSSLSPNPTSGEAALTFTIGRSGETTVRVYDTDGRMLSTLLEERLTVGEHRVEWNGRSYPAGTYYIRVSSGEWTGTARVIMVR